MMQHENIFCRANRGMPQIRVLDIRGSGKDYRRRANAFRLTALDHSSPAK